MIFPVIIFIFSILLESLFTNIISINSHLFIPLFSIVSLVIIYPYFNNQNLRYLKYCAIFGLIYDLIFTNTLIFNSVLFITVGLSIQLINIVISNNALNVIIINLFALTTYRIISYLFLIIIGYINHNFMVLLKGIYSSYVLNILFGLILYLITDYLSKKHRINKID